MREVFLGVDIGSSAVKVVAMDGTSEEITHVSRRQYERAFPAPGRIEIEPEALTGAVTATLRALPEDVRSHTAGIGFTGQMCSAICLDGHAEPVGNCISIFDTRATEQIAALEREHGEHLTAHEANHPLTIHTLPKLLWLRAHEPELYTRIRRVMTVKDYVRGVLTGTWVTEPSDASGTLIFDQWTGTWDGALGEALGLRPGLWPELVASAAPTGALTADAASATGLATGLPVVAGAADMAALPVGVGASTPASLIVSIGTAAHIIGPVNTLDHDVWPVQQYTQAIPGSWYRFGAVFSGGLAFDWILRVMSRGWRDHPFGAATLGKPENRPIFIPYLTGAGAPHYVPNAGGAFAGLRAEHDATDLAQAVMEGVAFEIADAWQSQDPRGQRKEIHVAGGAARNGMFVQILAGVLNREVILARSPDAAGIGAAVLARAGICGERFAPGTHVERRSGRIVAPADDAVGFYRDLAPRYRVAAAAIRELSSRLDGGAGE